MLRSALLTITLGLLLAAPAQAKPRMTYDLALDVAVAYWAGRDIAVPCRPQPVVMTAAEEDDINAHWSFPVYMLQPVDTCDIVISYTADAHRRDRDLDWLYCAGIVHEVGHVALGEQHIEGDEMMDATGASKIPWGCSHPRRFARAARSDRPTRSHQARGSGRAPGRGTASAS